MKELARKISLPYVLVVFGVFLSFDQFEWIGSIARVVGVPALLAWLGSVIITGRIRQFHPFHFLNLIFIGWCLATYFWSYDTDATVSKVYRLLLPYGLSLLMWDLYRTKKQVYSGMQWVVYAAYFVALSVLTNQAAGDFALSQRYSAIGLHPNDVPRLLGIALPIAWVLALEEGTHPINRLLNFGFPVVAGIAAVLTASRGGLISIAPAYLFILFTTGKIKGPLKVVIPALASLAALYAVKTINFSQQLARLTTSGDLTDANGRLDIWVKGLQLVSKHPFSGVGFGAYQEATRGAALQRTVFNEPLVAHNTYLSILTETGAIGMALFGAILISLALLIYRSSKNLRGALFVSLFVWAFGSFGSVWEEHTQTWLLFTIIVLCSGMLPDKDPVKKEELTFDPASRQHPIPLPLP